jgi:hypothetical protein
MFCYFQATVPLSHVLQFTIFIQYVAVTYPNLQRLRGEGIATAEPSDCRHMRSARSAAALPNMAVGQMLAKGVVNAVASIGRLDREAPVPGKYSRSAKCRGLDSIK